MKSSDGLVEVAIDDYETIEARSSSSWPDALRFSGGDPVARDLPGNPRSNQSLLLPAMACCLLPRDFFGVIRHHFTISANREIDLTAAACESFDSRPDVLT